MQVDDTKTIDNICYIDFIENYSVVPGDSENQGVLEGQPFYGLRKISKNRTRKIAIESSVKLPNLDPSNEDNKIFYYQTLLILFKPHRCRQQILESATSYEQAYIDFLANATCSESEMAIKHAMLNENYYKSMSTEEVAETEEQRINRMHPPIGIDENTKIVSQYDCNEDHSDSDAESQQNDDIDEDWNVTATISERDEAHFATVKKVRGIFRRVHSRISISK